MPRISAAFIFLPLDWASARSRYSCSNSFSAAASERRLPPGELVVPSSGAGDPGRQVLDVDLAAARQHDRVLDGVRELAHVAGERVLRQHRPGARRDRRRRLSRRA